MPPSPPRNCITCAAASATAAAPGHDQEEPTFSLELDYGQLLGIQPRTKYLPSAIRSAHADLVALDLEPGYSPDTIAARARLLERALRLSLARQDTQLQTSGDVVVPLSELPAVLVLLQQVDALPTVLQLAADVLSGAFDTPDAALTDSQRNDTLIAVAEARCSEAQDALEAGDVSLAWHRLQEAQTQLISNGRRPLAPKLSSDIRAAMADLRPHCSVLALVDPAVTGAGREAVLNYLRELLASQPGRASPDIAAQALARCTPVEAAALADWSAVARRPPSWAPPPVLRAAAKACLVVGLERRAPAHIVSARALLRAVGPDRGAGGDVSVELGVAELLLGRPEEAEAQLQEAARSGGTEPLGPETQLTRGGVMDYVRDHSRQGEEDLTSGVCVFVETYVRQVAAPAFRLGSAASATTKALSVAAYFEDPAVTSYIEAMPETDNNLAAAAGKLARGAFKELQPGVALGGLQQRVGGSSRGLTLLLGGGALLLAAGVGWAASGRGAPQAGSAPLAGTAATPAPVRPLSEAEVRGLVKKWLAAKAVAMGPAHDLSLLDRHLTGSALASYQKSARSLSRERCYMVYWGSAVQVLRVEPLGKRGDSLSALLEVQESASFVDAEGNTVKDLGYTGVYPVRYRLQHVRDRSRGSGWKIAEVGNMNKIAEAR